MFVFQEGGLEGHKNRTFETEKWPLDFSVTFKPTPGGGGGATPLPPFPAAGNVIQ